MRGRWGGRGGCGGTAGAVAMCTEMCDHDIIKCKKRGNNGQGYVKESSSLLVMGKVVGNTVS